jgi:hypothetical protein
MIDRNAILSRSEGVLEAQMGDEGTVLLGPDSDTYYGLEGTAVSVWAALETPRSLADLSAALTMEYEVDAATIETDVTPFLTEMIASGFITMRPAG